MVALPQSLPLSDPPDPPGRCSGTDKQVTRRVAIKRDTVDPTKRIVWGEVMVPPKVEIVAGGVYRESDVAEAMHYDWLFLGREAVRQLAYRMHGIRIDVGHDNEPIHATIAENYIARSGDPQFAEGAHVAGVRIGEGATYLARDGVKRDVWSGVVEESDLTGFSIDFRILVRKFEITITDEDGAHPRKQMVEEGVDPRPVFLSIVGGPAIGRHFAAAARAVVDYQDLPLAAEDAEWNAALAAHRVRQWAAGESGVDVAKFARAFVLRNEEDPALLGGYRLPIADVADGRLVAIPRAIAAAASALDATPMTDAERTAAEAHLGRYYTRLRRIAPWAADDTAQPEDTARATDEEASVPTPDPTIVDEADERAIGAVIMRTVRRMFGKPDADADPADVTGETADDAETAEGDADDVARGAFAEQVEEMAAGRAFSAAWFGFDALLCSFSSAYESVADDAQLEAMATAAEDFGAWLAAEIRRIAATDGGAETMRAAVERMRAIVDAAPDGDLVERARSFDALTGQVTQLEDTHRAATERIAEVEGELAATTERATTAESGRAEATSERDEFRSMLDEALKTMKAMRRAVPPGSALPADVNDAAQGDEAKPQTPHDVVRGSLF